MTPQGFGLPEHALPLSVQATAVFVVPVTEAWNCTDWVTYAVLMLLLVTVMLIPFPAPLPPLAQPTVIASVASAIPNKLFCSLSNLVESVVAQAIHPYFATGR